MIRHPAHESTTPACEITTPACEITTPACEITTPVCEFAGLADCVELGLTKIVGVSNHNVDQMRKAHEVR